MPRKQIKTPVYKSILLVVEGETEKIYFERLKALERFSNLRIKPDLPKHSDLRSLIDYAKAEAKTKAFDSVWVLFDRDVISTQNISKELLEIINNEQKCKNIGINIADSLPCFEIWFLLHYCIPSQFYNSQAPLLNELSKYITNYTKNNTWLDRNDIYKLLRDKMQVALDNSKKLRTRNSKSGIQDCSMCNVDLLINQIFQYAKDNTAQ